MSLVDFLNGLRGAGINAAVGVVLSFVAEWLPTWEQWDARVKRVVMLVLCLAVPLAATAGLAALGELNLSDVEVWWAALLAGATAFSANQIAHLRQLKP